MKENKIRTLLMLVLLPGCSLFTVTPDNTKSVKAEILDLKEESRLQREEIRLLTMKLNTMESPVKREAPRNIEELRRLLIVSKTPLKKNFKSRKPKIKIKEKVVTPLLEEDSTIADSSHEELHKYFKGLQFLREKKYDDGLQELREFIAENPTHIYADRAEMLITDAHLKNKDYGLAIVSTNVLENKYPHSVKLPDALYKRATSLIALEQKAEAKKVLLRILNSYPKSKIAEMAENKMASLNASKTTEIP